MLRKRNLLENASLISCSGLFICIVIYFVTDISPIQGLWFLTYLFVLFFLCILFSFKVLHWLLHLNKPLKYDVDSFVRVYPYLSLLAEVFPKVPQRELKETKEYDTNELSVITTVLERKLVSSWYVPYISEEISFPFACKQMLDQMIGKAFQICNKIETKDVYVDVCVILTTHLNEYKKALRRHEKCPTNNIENLYKKSHAISDITKKLSTADHCTNIVRVVLKHLVPWELWDSPQSELLVRILSKKLDSFIEGTLANPAWLNNQLITILKEQPIANIEVKASKETREFIQVSDEKPDEIDSTNRKIPETAKDTVIGEEPINILQGERIEASKATVIINKPLIEEVESANETLATIQEENKKTDSQEELGTEPVEIKATNSPILRQRRGRQGRNEVKIYDRIIEGSIKTWETDIDLQCISVGQDLLAQLDGEMTLSRLWGLDTDETSPNPPKTEPSTLWFGEEELDLELDGGPSKKEHSPKPTDALLKDIQSTVNQAKNKIGDLQVTCPIDVPCKQPSGDEAAGMMEGLLDFGIAGLKKGLRFTGLGDDVQDKSPTSQVRDRQSGRHSPVDQQKLDAQQTTLAPKELNGNGVPHLMKQNRVISQDSLPIVGVVYPAPHDLGSDSPEPQYEEVADLSASIAKLRCLLSQSPREYAACAGGEESWWEDSRSHVDTATLADEYDIHSERNTSPGQMSNNIQRLDKLLARTMTGVFNSLKTAVGSDDDAGNVANPRWLYVATHKDLSRQGAVSRVLGARRGAAPVHAARDPLQAPRRTTTTTTTTTTTNHHAAPLDLEEWCGAAGAGFSCSVSVLVAAGLCSSHVALTALTVLLADVAENFLTLWLDNLAEWLRTRMFSTFERIAEDATDVPSEKPTDEFNLDETCKLVMDNISRVQCVVGEQELTAAVRLVASSFTHKQLNVDVIYRALDLLVLHFNIAADERSSSFDVH